MSDVKNVLLQAIQGGDIDEQGNLIAKLSIMKLFQQFSTEIQIVKVTLEGDYINLYVSSKPKIDPIQVGNGVTLDIGKYVGVAITKIPINKAFLSELNLPIIGVEEVKVGDTTDVVLKINTGKKMPTTGAIDF
ncbi:hypothetical protein AFV7_gp46 [Betalipothrixvirus pezzuloense]|uniref:Uncharacterized protein n=1 Tax=Betalipothrixvirus pezzuloense TaxID=346883 RepID=A7WKR3_9VIRU|nr:hypothetical protein AFV7_gp46 [Acidianus filamentous virus 7]CAJ31666.1 conserved hypothetical protein [Acidianus filamentous virus 7]